MPRTKGVRAKDYVLHIPNGGDTFCGRSVSAVNCCGEMEWLDSESNTFYEWCCRLCGPLALKSYRSKENGNQV